MCQQGRVPVAAQGCLHASLPDSKFWTQSHWELSVWLHQPPVEHPASLPAGSHGCLAPFCAGGHMCSHTGSRIPWFGMQPSAAIHCQIETMSLSSHGGTRMFPVGKHFSLHPSPDPWQCLWWPCCLGVTPQNMCLGRPLHVV